MDSVKVAERGMIVADPVHGLLDFGRDQRTRQAIEKIIDNSAFQRLRQVTQLGLASYVFPGATHTRFAHSLGAAHLARAVIQHLGDPEAAEQQNAIILAALLHDVGHGPFSHSFERAMGANEGSIPDHEKWTVHLIETVFADALNGAGVEVAGVVKLLSKQAGIPGHWQQIVSSQLDVDRMDYLVRDAHFAGVSLGKIDVGYLIRSLEVIKHGGGLTTLGVATKGVRAYEAYALARHQMNRSVYFHPVVKVLEFMMEECIRCVMRSIKDGDSALQSDTPEFLRRTAGWKGNDQKGFLEAHRESYLALTESELWTMVRRLARLPLSNASGGTTRAVHLAQRLLERRTLPYFMVLPGRLTLLERAIEERGEVKRCAVIPAKSTLYKDSSDPVFVAGDYEPRPITEQSFAIAAYNDRPERQDILVLLEDDATLQGHVAPFVVQRGRARPVSTLKPVAKVPSWPPPDAASGSTA